MEFSQKWKTWKAVVDFHTCFTCRKNHGKIYNINEYVEPPPVHSNCRCIIERLKALLAGTATNDGINGADWNLKYHNTLPDYYITNEKAFLQGYQPLLGNLAIVAPGKMLTKGIYKNRNGNLPTAYGRVWYEADINYVYGYRNGHRILFSNDGLIFVTYDHYMTFYEIL